MVIVPRLPLMVALTVAATPMVVTLNVVVEAPAGTVTFVGADAEVLLELRFTIVPLVPAGPLRFTEPMDTPPPTIDAGESATETRAAELIVSVADWTEAPSVAVRVTETVEPTPIVVAVNTPEVLPAAMVTDAGTVALVELEVSEITLPEGPAGPFRVTVPVAEVPPVTAVGEMESPETWAGVTVREAV